jgi:hypothetical protein
LASTDIDYERWHDGVGYDLAALAALEGRDRAEAERWLLARAGSDWRDLEGLLTVATGERTPAMLDALLRACLRDEGEAAVHAAARLAFIHGKAKEAFDWELRPLFLRFNTPDRTERESAFRDLCATCGIDPAPYLRT